MFVFLKYFWFLKAGFLCMTLGVLNSLWSHPLVYIIEVRDLPVFALDSWG